MDTKDLALLEELVSIQGVSGDESRMKQYILNYISENSADWSVQPEVFAGEEFQDCIVLVFGEPRTAIYAHTDTIGFSVGYENNLIKVGGPRLIDETKLVGVDRKGNAVETELMLIEDEEGNVSASCISEKPLERGLLLSFKSNFRVSDEFVQSPYMDNRLGVWNALKVAESLENGAIVFSTYEEHGGNSVGYCARFLNEKYGVRQALISDITWVTDGVVHGKGVAISMRDSGLPRRKYLNRIIDLAEESGLEFQLEVESAGGSDGTMLQKGELLIDWCFIGAPEDNVHTPDEKVAIKDIDSMLEMYRYLMAKL